MIAMTAQALPGDEERLRSAGLTDYIAKPIDEEGLCGVLAPWLPDLRGRAAHPVE